MKEFLIYFYYPSIWIYFVLAVSIGIFSIKKYNYLSMEVLGLTYVGFQVLRMLNQFSCGFTSPYFWDKDLYIYGSYLTITFSLIMLASSLAVPRTYYLKQRKLLINNLTTNSYSNQFIPIFSIMVALFGLLFYGNNIAYRFSESNSALSVDGPAGISVYFWIFSGSIIYLSYYFALKIFTLSSLSRFKLIDKLSLILAITVAYLLGKRGIIVTPILTFISFSSILYGFREISATFNSKISSIIYRFKVSKFFLLAVIFSIFALYGVIYIVFKAFSDFQLLGFADESLCLLITTGGQEYDQLWPLVLKTFPEFSFNFLLIPFAFAGQFIDHYIRLLEFPSIFHSITDTLMLNSYASEFYITKKFGISPTLSQFYWAYFGAFSLLLAPFLGYYKRYILFRFFPLFARSIPLGYVCISLSSLPLVAFDFIYKYILVSSLMGYILFRLLAAFSKSLSKPKTL